MKRPAFGALVGCVVVGLATSAATSNSAPVVSNVTAAQRPDASKLVDIRYSLADADGDPCTVWVVVSDNGGATWSVPAYTLSGDVGANVLPGSGKLITWDAGRDMPGRVGNFRVRVWADDGKGPAPMVLVPGGWFPYQRGSQIFVPTFLIDKYEVTNNFYCQFLNNADPTGAHWDVSMEISRLGNPGSYSYTVQPGREQHPVRWVSAYDAEAFAAWRSQREGVTYRLPTEQEWEKAAAWDPVEERYYTYGFHRDSIDCSWCNYNRCVGDTRPVGFYSGTGGRNDARSYYGCYDMSGNLWEWTSSMYDSTSRVLRGGSWFSSAENVACARRHYGTPAGRSNVIGIRLVLDPQ